MNFGVPPKGLLVVVFLLIEIVAMLVIRESTQASINNLEIDKSQAGNLNHHMLYSKLKDHSLTLLQSEVNQSTLIDLIDHDSKDQLKSTLSSTKDQRYIFSFLPISDRSTRSSYMVLISEDNLNESIEKEGIVTALSITILIIILFLFSLGLRSYHLKLITSRAKYRSILENIGHEYFFYIYGKDKNITYVSDSVSGILGYSKEEFMTDYERYLTGSPLNKSVASTTQMSLKGITQPSYRVEMYHQDGTKKWLELTETPQFDEKGEVISVDGLAKNITDEMRVDRLIRNSQTILFYWKAAEDWPVEFVSGNVSLFGYTSDDFTSGKILYSKIIHPDDYQRVATEVQVYTAKGVDNFVQVYRIYDVRGKVRWIDDRTIIERNSKGEAIYYLGTVVEITNQIQIS